MNILAPLFVKRSIFIRRGRKKVWLYELCVVEFMLSSLMCAIFAIILVMRILVINFASVIFFTA